MIILSFSDDNNANNAKAIAIPRVFSENSRAKNLNLQEGKNQVYTIIDVFMGGFIRCLTIHAHIITCHSKYCHIYSHLKRRG